MPVPTLEVKTSILSLIDTNWVDTNIVGTVTPDFHTGWFNPKSTTPQVTFNGQNETYEGASGYAAIEGSGGGPVQVVDGICFVNCWASRLNTAAASNPKQVAYDMAEEVRRIVLANFDGITNLTYISIISVDDVPPQKGPPMTFRKAVQVGFNWRTT